MREILFRGRRIDNREWAYGYVLIDNAKCALKSVGKCKCDHDGLRAAVYAWNDDLHEYEELEVDALTVGQYTGLKDKNGYRIFEDDIMSFSAYGTDYVGKVEFIDGNFCITCKSAYPFLDDAIKRHEAVKVGNIHDRSELLDTAEV